MVIANAYTMSNTVTDYEIVDGIITVTISDEQPVTISLRKFEDWLCEIGALTRAHIDHYQDFHGYEEMTFEEYWSVHNESQKGDIEEYLKTRK